MRDAPPLHELLSALDQKPYRDLPLSSEDIESPESRKSIWQQLRSFVLVPGLLFAFYVASPFLLVAPAEQLGWLSYNSPLQEFLDTFYMPLDWYLNQDLPGTGLYNYAIRLAGL